MTHPTRRTVLTAGALAAAMCGSMPVASAVAQGSQLTLVDRGRPKATVVWWGDRVTGFAVQEFADYVHRMSGARLAVRQVKAPVGAAAAGFAAGVGNPSFGTMPSDWVTRHNTLLAPAPVDSFVTEVLPSRLVLTGRTGRAVLYAAYAALEQLGVGFFAPSFAYYQGTSEVVPKHSTINLPAQAATLSSPSFSLRRKDIEEGWSINDGDVAALVDWMAKARFNTLVFPYDYYGAGVTVYDDFRTVVRPELAKRGLDLELGGHGYNSFLSPDDYPHYYAAGYNVFDVENAEALATYVDKVVAYLRERPEITTFDCWPPDGATWSPATIANFGSVTNAEVEVVNSLVAALQSAGLQVQVERIAYAVGLDVPTAGHVFDPSVLIDFAAYGRSYDAAIDDSSSATNASYYDVLTQWRAAHSGDLAIYDYSRRYRWREVGSPFAVLAADALAYQRLSLTGVESYGEPGNWLQFEALHLFTGRSAWDSQLSAKSFLDDYTAARFGKGAAAMSDYFTQTGVAQDGVGRTGGGAAFLARYQAAQRDTKRARAAVGASHPAALSLERLTSGCTLALADIGMTAARQAGDATATTKALDDYRRLTELLRFSGVQLESSYVADTYGHSVTRAQIATEYRSPAWCYLPDWEIDASSGSSVAVKIVAQPVDYADHTVTWTLKLPSGVHAAKTTGTLNVRGAASDETTVTLDLDPASGGDLDIDLEFVVDGGSAIASNTTTIRKPYGTLADAYDNVGITHDGTQPSGLGGGLDGDGSTLSLEALAVVGLVGGATFQHGGISYQWPVDAAGVADNVLAYGQTIAVATKGRLMGLLITGSYSKDGPKATGTVNYTDGSSSSYTVVAPDWGYPTPPSTADVAATMTYRNLGGQRSTRTTRLFAATISLDAGKDVASITLPRVSDHPTGGTAAMHVFALGTETGA
ncbi:DUF4838 domain-containing protein [Flexivirga alba]|uniref:DUF4838 domain-containing protein n=1 Tax=Flexivirga alba TaxID=702742 RepID=A0ABW2ABM3_9MICO